MGDSIVRVVKVVGFCFVAWLLLCAFIVIETGSTDGLVDAGEATRRAFEEIVKIVPELPSSGVVDR